MVCYIKDFKNFEIIEKYETSDYSLSDGEDGYVKVNGKDLLQLSSIYRGCWLVIPSLYNIGESIDYAYDESILNNGGTAINISGKNLIINKRDLSTGGIEYSISSNTLEKQHSIYYISECNPENDSLSLILKDPIYAFKRQVLYSGEKTYGELITRIINNDFGFKCQDPKYAMPYLEIEGTSKLECDITPDAYGYIVPFDVLEYAKKIGVGINFYITKNNRLKVKLSDENRQYGYVIFGDGHSQLADESYESTYYTKVTVLQDLQEQSMILAESFQKKFSENNIVAILQISQNISSTYKNKKSMLMARVAFIRSEYDTEIKYTNSELKIYNEAQEGQELLNTTFEWEMKKDAGSATTDWFEIQAIDESASHTLFFELIPNRYPQGTESETFDTLSDYINVDNIVKSSEIKFGPYDADFSRPMYRLVDYYLTEDGRITDDREAAIYEGEWIIVNGSSDTLPIDVALETFSLNSDNHKIEFYSDQYFSFYQPIRMRIRNGVFDTLVTSRTITGTDGRYYYKCGRLLTRMTEKIKVLNNQYKNINR